MISNLKTSSAFKDLLLKKLSYAVTCSVLSHILVVLLYIFIVNFNIHPVAWLKHTFDTLTSLSTWLYLISFSSIIFAQIIICAKDYVLKSCSQLTRFRKIMAIVSIRTFALGLLHVTVGGIVVWLYLSLQGGPYQTLVIKCKGEDYCLVEGNFFLIIGGFWTGFYFFVKVYVADRNIVFPTIQQRKLLHFKANFVTLLKESRSLALYPTGYYIILYFICGSYLRDSLAYTFKLHVQSNDFGILLYVYMWIFSILYILNMNLMRFFFELFLTEPVEHPIMSMYENDASLSEALLLNNIPILQHLACLDLYLLSIWSPQRRQALFTLSQPGGHPHTWNRLLQGALQLMTEFTDTLNRSTDGLLHKEEIAPVTRHQLVTNQMTPSLQSPLQKPPKLANMRNMALSQPVDSYDIISVSQSPRYVDVTDISETPATASTTRVTNILETIRRTPAVRYIFGELPEAQIQQCLKNGQLIVWVTQGLANVVVASFNEDPYGIVQKDLPVLITSLVQLKQSIDKLNKAPTVSRRGPNFDDFSFKMKNSVHSAVKRSLCTICRTFGKYLIDVPLKKDITAQLQCYL